MLRSARLVVSSRHTTARLPSACAARACLVVADSHPGTSRWNSNSTARSSRHGLSFGPMRRRVAEKSQDDPPQPPQPTAPEQQPSTSSSSSQPPPQTSSSHDERPSANNTPHMDRTPSTQQQSQERPLERATSDRQQTQTSISNPPNPPQRPPIRHAESQSTQRQRLGDQPTTAAPPVSPPPQSTPALANAPQPGNPKPNRFSYSSDIFGNRDPLQHSRQPTPSFSETAQARSSQAAQDPRSLPSDSHHSNFEPATQAPSEPRTSQPRQPPPPPPSQPSPHSSHLTQRPSPTSTQQTIQVQASNSTSQPSATRSQASARHGLNFGPIRRPTPTPTPQSASSSSQTASGLSFQSTQPPHPASSDSPATATRGGLSFGPRRSTLGNSEQPAPRHGLTFGPMRRAASSTETNHAEQGRNLDSSHLPSGSSRAANSARHGLDFGPMRSRPSADSRPDTREANQRHGFDANIFGPMRRRTPSDREDLAGSGRSEGAFQGQRDSRPSRMRYGNDDRGGDYDRREFDRRDYRNRDPVRRNYGRQDQQQQSRGGERWQSAPLPEPSKLEQRAGALFGQGSPRNVNNEARWTSDGAQPVRGRGLGYTEERQGEQSADASGEGDQKKAPSAKVWSTPEEDRPKKREVEDEEREFKRPVERRTIRESETDRKLREIAQAPKEVFLPEMISVNNLSRLVGTRPAKLRQTMLDAGLTDTRPAALLKFDDAAMICAEFNLNAVSNDEAAFDIYPAVTPTPEEKATLPLRPPVVTVMGHVDHGKTSLLDRLRSASVAAGEAGGITQHIGAFSVPVKAAAGTSDVHSVNKITFLDTPGHAAFSNMRARGAKATDIVVLVVAADDGVMAQTKEVIQLYHSLEAEARASAEAEAEGSSDGNKDGDATKRKKNNIQLMVALSKCDRPAADVQRAKEQLAAESIYVEDLSGDVPCVEISSKTGQGFDTLEETLAVMAELGELRSPKTGSPEGIVLESRTEKGLGNTATVLVTRGELKAGSFLISGTCWAKVRGMVDSNRKNVKSAGPGEAVLVSGWRELPEAGEEVLSAAKEDMIKRAVENRKASHTRRQMVKEAEAVNEARRKQREEAERAAEAEHEERLRIRKLWLAENRRQEMGEEEAAQVFEEEQEETDEAENSSTELREVRVVIKSDFSGTGEALEGAISGLVLSTSGYTAKVKVISMGVGDLSDGDLAMAKAAVEADHRVALVGFNVKAARNIQQAAKNEGIEIYSSAIIYEIIDYIKSCLSGVLPPNIETRVTGEATIAQIFTIAGSKGRDKLKVAGSKVTNGVIARANKVRVLRPSSKTDENGERILDVIFDGNMSSLRQVKKEVSEMRKGTECGISFDGFDGFEEGDLIRSIEQTEVPVSYR